MAGRKGNPQDLEPLILLVCAFHLFACSIYSHVPIHPDNHRASSAHPAAFYESLPMTIRHLACVILATALSLPVAWAAGEPRIAVTDLTYEEKVSEYFRTVDATSRNSLTARHGEVETDFGRASHGQVQTTNENTYHTTEHAYTYIERGELRTYTADLKGALLKDGRLRLVQARPYAGRPTERIHDIIGRIKQGNYPGADYVLFGTVSNIAFRQESMPLAMGTSSTANLTLDLVADFSLINTRTFEIKAAFSANGSGQDTKIVAHNGDQVVLNRSKVMQETSRSLAENAYQELLNQLGIGRRVQTPHAGDGPNPPTGRSPADEAEVRRATGQGNGPVVIIR